MMKHIFLAIAFCALLVSCNNTDGVKIYYGEKFDVAQPISTDELIQNIDANGTTPTLQVAGTIEKSCTHSGCWMTLENTSNQKIFVTYKDNAFTTAKKIDGKKVVLQGEGSHNSDKDQYEFVAEGIILN